MGRISNCSVYCASQFLILSHIDANTILIKLGEEQNNKKFLSTDNRPKVISFYFFALILIDFCSSALEAKMVVSLLQLVHINSILDPVAGDAEHHHLHGEEREGEPILRGWFNVFFSYIWRGG